MSSERIPWHQQSGPDSAQALGVSPQTGLSAGEVQARQAQHGPNQLAEAQGRSLLMVFFSQFKDVMIWVLLAAAIISACLGEWVDAIIIAVVVVLNAVLGTIQESKAEAALAALKQMAAPSARVLRDGNVARIEAKDLVPGDIVLFEAGDSVPADVRLLESAALKAEESALTGESVPVEKDAQAVCAADAALGDRINMAFMGTSITYGRGNGVVVETGMATQMGAIAGQLQEPQEQSTPLQEQLNSISKKLAVGVLVIAAVIFGIGLLTGREGLEMFMTAVSLAVAAIPEGMVAVVTVVLAMGMQRMAGRGAIVRKLPAVETLGSTHVICSDKTGTLTLNRMTVRETVPSDGQALSGDHPLLQGMLHCNDTRLDDGGKAVGDPTETALVDYLLQQGLADEGVVRGRSRVGEIPFDSERKLMSVGLAVSDGVRVLTKGAPDVLMARCNRIRTSEGVLPMTEEHRAILDGNNAALASLALRVLAFAYKDEPAFPQDAAQAEQGLVFCGLVGMIDPARPEAKDAIGLCGRAGIAPVMITGDHRDTAVAIAQDLGILQDGRKAITGAELEAMDDETLRREVRNIGVYARVAPEHKSRIVKAWQANDCIVAMTGDGVNDAPALRAADIGVGMGITGTDVSKAASDMVLTDDNFATIVTAVGEGRRIYDNIHKTVRFLLSSNAGEVIALLAATVAGITLLQPVHILWVNLVTDSLPALALGVEPAEPDVMDRPPRKAHHPLLSGYTWMQIGVLGLVEAILTLAAFLIGNAMGGGATATTMAFLTLGLNQLCASVALYSERQPLLKIHPTRHRMLLLAFLAAAILQFAVVLIPPLRTAFELVLPTWGQLGIIAGLCVVMVLFTDLQKLLRKARHKEL